MTLYSSQFSKRLVHSSIKAAFSPLYPLSLFLSREPVYRIKTIIFFNKNPLIKSNGTSGHCNFRSVCDAISHPYKGIDRDPGGHFYRIYLSVLRFRYRFFFCYYTREFSEKRWILKVFVKILSVSVLSAAKTSSSTPLDPVIIQSAISVVFECVSLAKRPTVQFVALIWLR